MTTSSVHSSFLSYRLTLLIDDYIRQAQDLLPQHVIPNTINSICYVFYYKPYIGLTNSGATDYMNAVLQCLYHTPEIRHALFSWHYNPPLNTQFDFEFIRKSDKSSISSDNTFDQPPQHSFLYQLQCLFARLHQSTESACRTSALSNAFGWTRGDQFRQPDALEVMDVLLDAVYKQMKNAKQYKNILTDYMECLVCRRHYYRSRDDTFTHLFVRIKGFDNLHDALLETVLNCEVLDGDNKVFCDFMTMQRIKLKHKFTFPMELDMRCYVDEELQKDMDNQNEWMYSLYAVILHSGGNVGGHTYAFIKPFNRNEWFEFNDSRVVNLNESEKQFDEVFGGKNVHGSAYMLFYRQQNLQLPDKYS
eukprot:622964_1